MSLVVNRLGLFGIEPDTLNIWRILGATPMVSSIALIAAL
jgi:hypothetical protein